MTRRRFIQAIGAIFGTIGASQSSAQGRVVSTVIPSPDTNHLLVGRVDGAGSFVPLCEIKEGEFPDPSRWTGMHKPCVVIDQSVTTAEEARKIAMEMWDRMYRRKRITVIEYIDA